MNKTANGSRGKIDQECQQNTISTVSTLPTLPMLPTAPTLAMAIQEALSTALATVVIQLVRSWRITLEQSQGTANLAETGMVQFAGIALVRVETANGDNSNQAFTITPQGKTELLHACGLAVLKWVMDFTEYNDKTACNSKKYCTDKAHTYPTTPSTALSLLQTEYAKLTVIGHQPWICQPLARLTLNTKLDSTILPKSLELNARLVQTGVLWGFLLPYYREGNVWQFLRHSMRKSRKNSLSKYNNFRIQNKADQPEKLSELEEIRRHQADILRLALVIAMAKTLKHCHDAGWIHGDVKPSNFLLQPSHGTVTHDADAHKSITTDCQSSEQKVIVALDGQGWQMVLTDVALAQPIQSPANTDLIQATCPNHATQSLNSITDTIITDTASMSVAGTPRYLAPECWQGQRKTPASDIYAFAVSALELLAQTPETTKRTESIKPTINPKPAGMTEVLASSNMVELPSPWQPLQPLVAQMLTPDPTQRLQDWAEILQALEAMLIELDANGIVC